MTMNRETNIERNENYKSTSDRRWLIAGRLAWVGITILTLALVIAGAPQRYSQLLAQAQADRITLQNLGMAQSTYAGYMTGLDLIVVFAHMAVALFIFSRSKVDLWAALLVMFALVTSGSFIPLSRMYAPATMHPVWQTLINGVIYVGLISGTGLLFLFPDGRFVPRWTRWPFALWGVITFLAIFFPGLSFSFPHWPLFAQILTLLLVSGMGVFAQLYRYYNVSSSLRRQQIKWALIGLVASIVGPFVYFLPFVILPNIDQPIVPNFMRNLIGPSFFSFSLVFRMVTASTFTLLLLILPFTFAIAILRYRLWDIDIIIRRTLIYTSLTAFLALVYFVSIAILEILFRAITGQQSPIVIVLSTLAIAALFNPLRRWVQEIIDQRFYRSKYDAEKTMAAFVATCRDEVELERLANELLKVTEKTMRPEHTSLWLTKERDRR